MIEFTKWITDNNIPPDRRNSYWRCWQTAQGVKMKEYQDRSNYILYDFKKAEIISFHPTLEDAAQMLAAIGNPVDVEVRPCHKFYSSCPSG